MAVHSAVMMSDMCDETTVGEWAVTMADLSVAGTAAVMDTEMAGLRVAMMAGARADWLA